MKKNFLLILFLGIGFSVLAQGTRLLREPNISETRIAFTYGGDVWVYNMNDKLTTRLTSTGAVESNPYISPDGKTVAFSSNRSGTTSVYTVSVEGGTPTRLTWYPSSANVCGWTPDGEKILYTSARETAPSGYGRLWRKTVVLLPFLHNNGATMVPFHKMEKES